MSDLTHVNRELFYASMVPLDDSKPGDVKKMVLLLAKYCEYMHSQNGVNFTTLGIKADAVSALLGTTFGHSSQDRKPRVTKPPTKVEESPGDKPLFETCPNSRMSNRVLGRMLLHGDEDDKKWVMNNIPVEMHNLKECDYIDAPKMKALENLTDAEKPIMLNKYLAGHIWANMEKKQRVSFYKNIKQWYNDHLIKRKKPLKKEAGNEAGNEADTIENDNCEEKEDSSECVKDIKEAKPLPKPIKRRTRGKKLTVKPESADIATDDAKKKKPAKKSNKGSDEDESDMSSSEGVGDTD